MVILKLAGLWISSGPDSEVMVYWRSSGFSSGVLVASSVARHFRESPDCTRLSTVAWKRRQIFCSPLQDRFHRGEADAQIPGILLDATLRPVRDL
jgi:hypothetical protein